MNIYLLRHGETDWNTAGRLQGHVDIPLNQKGIQQIECVASTLAELNPCIDTIISSPLLRAKKSAEIAAEKLNLKKTDIVTEPLFIERSFGSGEGMIWKEANEKFGVGNFPGMEPWEELLQRAKTAFDQTAAKYEGHNILILSHGAILAAAAAAITNKQIPSESDIVPFEQGSIYLARIEGSSVEMLKYALREKKFVTIA